MFLGVARRVPLHSCPAMRAPVDEHVHSSILGSAHHDRRIAHERGLEVAGRRDLRFQRHVVPQRTAENAFLLALEHVLAGVDLERHPGAVGDGPGTPAVCWDMDTPSLTRVYRQDHTASTCRAPIPGVSSRAEILNLIARYRSTTVTMTNSVSGRTVNLACINPFIPMGPALNAVRNDTRIRIRGHIFRVWTALAVLIGYVYGWLYRPEALTWWKRTTTSLIQAACGLLPYPWGDRIESTLGDFGLWVQITLAIIAFRIAMWLVMTASAGKSTPFAMDIRYLVRRGWPAGIGRNSGYSVMICPPPTADRNVATPAISTDGSNAPGSIASARNPASHAISRTPSSIDASRNSSRPATPAA